MKKILLLFFLIVMITPGYSQASLAIPEDFCITQEENKLYELITQYRDKFNLTKIPLSQSLSFVAKVHVRDLSEHRPDTSYCNMNSWSDKGPWTACCHSKYNLNPGCIVNKPRELTKYKGEGHELSYWDSQNAIPDTVFNFWLTIEEAKNLILNQKKWSTIGWQAIGVGIYQGYASVWFGSAVDSLTSPGTCDKNKGDVNIVLPEKITDNVTVTTPTERYYVIIASLKSLEDAQKELKKFTKKGFYGSKIVIKEGVFRISLFDFAEMQEARDSKAKLGKEYKGAWILKY